MIWMIWKEWNEIKWNTDSKLGVLIEMCNKNDKLTHIESQLRFQLMLDMWLRSFRDGKKWTVENEQNDRRKKKYENTWKVLWIISD